VPVISVNGKSVTVAEQITVTDLVQQLQVSGRFAVEVNEEIVPSSQHARRQLYAGDRVEIVQAIGGG
jgi:sulfur carrier protein